MFLPLELFFTNSFFGGINICMVMEISEAMAAAFQEAEKAAARGEVPVGASISDASGKLIAAFGNRTRELQDPTAHAEILVIREACRIAGSERLNGFDLHVTLEPCPMCAAAISAARIRRLYYAASDEKMGGVEHGARIFQASSCHHQPEIISGIGEAQARQMLQEFFAQRR
jgi:tRNA(adenine34) deaminase